MNNDNKDFDPMLSIPSMEELDRQWKEKLPRITQKRHREKIPQKEQLPGHNNARNNAQRRTMAEAPETE